VGGRRNISLLGPRFEAGTRGEGKNERTTQRQKHLRENKRKELGDRREWKRRKSRQKIPYTLANGEMSDKRKLKTSLPHSIIKRNKNTSKKKRKRETNTRSERVGNTKAEQRNNRERKK